MLKKKITAPVQSLQRGLSVLAAVAHAHRPVSLIELTQRVQLDRSCVFRLANTLAQRGFLVQSPRTKQYTLGPAIWELVGHMRQGSPLLGVARRYLAMLTEQTGETAHLSVRQDDRAVSLEHQLSDQLMGITTSAGRLEPLHCSAVGKALIADFDRQSLNDLFGTGRLPARTERTIRTVSALYKECQSVSAKGYAVDNEEYADGVRCVAAPVRDFHSDIIAAIGISAPADRLAKRQINAIGRLVTSAAEQLSKELGYVKPAALLAK